MMHWEKWRLMGLGAKCWLGLESGWEIENREWDQGVAGRSGVGSWAVSRRDQCRGRYCFWFLLMIWMKGWVARYWNLRMIPRFMEELTVGRIEIGYKGTWRDWLIGQIGSRWLSMLGSVKLCTWVDTIWSGIIWWVSRGVEGREGGAWSWIGAEGWFESVE